MASARQGRLLVIEGPDGVGKSTLARRAAARLRSAGHDVLLTSFPGSEAGSLGKLVYGLHHAPAAEGVKAISAAALQALHLAAHIDGIDSRILPALAAGRVVIVDRYWWSLAVYGRTAGVRPALLQLLIRAERVAWNGRLPIVCLLTRRRLDGHQSARLIAEYRQLAKRQSRNHPVHVLSNEGSLSDLTSAYLKLLRTALPHRHPPADV